MRDRRSIKVAGPAIVAGLILTAPPASAADATGAFSYGTGNSPQATIDNPALGRCYATKGTASSGINKTDVVAQIFKDSDCKQLAATIAPGQSEQMVTFASVKFQNPVPAPAIPGKP
jgi:hypothetical protein